MPRQPSGRDDFRFAVICALPLEYDAVYDSFDEIWADKDFGKAIGDPNRYATGCMGDLAVVLVLLPGMGKVNAASAAASMRSSYINLSVALVVGICGAVPKLADETEVVLGDVIISRYVVQYDFGRQYPDELKPKKTIEDTLGRGNKETRVLNAQLETRSGRDELEVQAQEFLQHLQAKLEATKYRGIYDYHGMAHDKLFNPEYRHKHQDTTTCDICSICRRNADPVCDSALELKCADLGCSDAELIYRNRLEQRQQAGRGEKIQSPPLAIHTGGFGSADTVLKSGGARDRLSKRDKVIAFEMEGAGVWDELSSCIIVKGVCDYADSHKPKGWQKYAAATAASTAKALLRSYFQGRQTTQQTQNRIFHVPFAENDEFVGREELIESLLDSLFAQKKSRVALVGMGGVGKTQVALKLAYMIENKDPECSVLWLPAFSVAGFEQACADLTQKLDLPRSQDDDARDVMRHYLSTTVSARFLIILDNADDEEVLRGLYSSLPRTRNVQVLLTTRWQKIAVDFAKNSVISVAEMGHEDAKNLMRVSLILEQTPWNDHAVDELLRLLTHLPLAIAQAAAYINIFQVSIEEYLTLCYHSQNDMMELMRSQYQDETLYDESQCAVATTWLISFSKLRKQNPAAASLLFFIRWIEPQAIPRSILPDVGSEQEKVKAIGALRSYGFLRARPEPGLFDMHSLVHMVMQFWTCDQGIDKETRSDMLDHLVPLFQSDAWEMRETWRAHLPHILHVFQLCQNTNSIEVSELGFWAGRCLIQDGRIKEAATLLEHVVKIRETSLAEDHPFQLASQHALAVAYQSNGQTKEAVALLEHVVKVEETSLAEDHPSRLTSQYELAAAYKSNGQIKEAVTLLEHVVKVEEISLAEDHPDRLASQHALAGAYGSNGQIKEAGILLEHVVQIRETSLAEDHPSRLASQHTLAQAYKSNGRIKEAVALLEHVVKARETSLAEDHPDRLASQRALAQAYESNGQIKEAVALLEHVVNIRKTSLAEDHPDRLASQHALAVAYQSNGQIKEAVALLEHVVKVEETSLAEDHPDRLASQHALAQAYESNGQINEAVILLEHVVQIREISLAEDHPSRLASQHTLAQAYRSNGQIKEAVALLEHVVNIRKTSQAEDHPDRLASQQPTSCLATGRYLRPYRGCSPRLAAP